MYNKLLDKKYFILVTVACTGSMISQLPFWVALVTLVPSFVSARLPLALLILILCNLKYFIWSDIHFDVLQFIYFDLLVYLFFGDRTWAIWFFYFFSSIVIVRSLCHIGTGAWTCQKKRNKTIIVYIIGWQKSTRL